MPKDEISAKRKLAWENQKIQEFESLLERAKTNLANYFNSKDEEKTAIAERIVADKKKFEEDLDTFLKRDLTEASKVRCEELKTQYQQANARFAKLYHILDLLAKTRASQAVIKRKVQACEKVFNDVAGKRAKDPADQVTLLNELKRLRNEIHGPLTALQSLIDQNFAADELKDVREQLTKFLKEIQTEDCFKQRDDKGNMIFSEEKVCDPS